MVNYQKALQTEYDAYDRLSESLGLRIDPSVPLPADALRRPEVLQAIESIQQQTHQLLQHLGQYRDKGAAPLKHAAMDCSPAVIAMQIYTAYGAAPLATFYGREI